MRRDLLVSAICLALTKGVAAFRYKNGESDKRPKKRDALHIFILVNIKICLIQLGSCPTLVVVFTEDDLIYIRKSLTFFTSNCRLDISYRLCDSSVLKVYI